MYPPAHGDTYRPYSGGQSYRDSHAFPRSDSYRPQYDDTAWRSPQSGDKLNTDAYHPRRPPSLHDHDDTRSSTSIASTPPRRAGDSPPPDPHPSDRGRRSTSSRRASPAHLVARSRVSSTPSEPPRKRLKSRSSSQSSASSRADKSVIFTRNRLNDTTSVNSVQQILMARDSDRLVSLRGSAPNSYFKSNSFLQAGTLSHEFPHVDAKPVMNGELNGPPLGRSSLPSLLSGEGTIILFSSRYP